MKVARVTEMIASSEKSFDDAMKVGVARACKTLTNVSGAWVKDQTVVIAKNKIVEYRANLKVTFSRTHTHRLVQAAGLEPAATPRSSRGR